MKRTPAPVVPGIDACDHLFSLYSRSGQSAVYIRVHEFPDGFRAALTVDCEEFSDSLPADGEVHLSPEVAARANLQTARAWFAANGLQFTYGDRETRLLARGHDYRTKNRQTQQPAA